MFEFIIFTKKILGIISNFEISKSVKFTYYQDMYRNL